MISICTEWECVLYLDNTIQNNIIQTGSYLFIMKASDKYHLFPEYNFKKNQRLILFLDLYFSENTSKAVCLNKGQTGRTFSIMKLRDVRCLEIEFVDISSNDCWSALLCMLSTLILQRIILTQEERYCKECSNCVVGVSPIYNILW